MTTLEPEFRRNQVSTWEEELTRYCLDFDVPIEHLAEILKDPKVNPMIRGKGFEFSAMNALRNFLQENIWTVSRPSTNPQAMDHDVDILILHNASSKTVSVECKLSGKGSFKITREGETRATVKCMRSRTLGVEVIRERAPLMGVSIEQLTAHKDSYQMTDFDLVISSLGNAFYETDDETGTYTWRPDQEHLAALREILGSETADLKQGAFDYLIVAKASDLAPLSGFRPCNRRSCTEPTTCNFLPNYPIVDFDTATWKPRAPWHVFAEIESLLLGVIGE